MSKFRLQVVLSVALVTIGWVPTSIAQNEAGGTSASSSTLSEQELARKSQNPIANLISVPNELNYFTDIGPTDADNVTFLSKPVIPTGFSDNWLLINRFIIPVTYQEGQDPFTLDGVDFPGTSSETGLGNIQYQGFFTQKDSGRFIWGIGPAIEMPTASDDVLGPDVWSAGPAFVGLTMTGPWVLGILVQNLWDVHKSSGEPDINKLTLQYFINYNMNDGWYLTSQPVNTVNWEADRSGDKLTLPLGGGVGRIIKSTKYPLDLRFSIYKNVERPEFGAEWQYQFQLKLMFPQ